MDGASASTAALDTINVLDYVVDTHRNLNMHDAMFLKC